MKRTFTTVLALAVVALWSSQASAAIIASNTLTNGLSEYTLLTADSGETISDMQAYASGTLGGNLVTINDATENAWLVANYSGVTGLGFVAIGANDVATEGTFVWYSGQAFSYTNWDTLPSNQPDGTAGENYTAIIMSTGAWHDIVNNGTTLALAEVAIPEPASMALLGLGGLLLAGRNRRQA